MYLRAIGRGFTQMIAYFLVMNSKRCNPKVLDLTLEQLKDNIKQLTGEISGRKKAKNPSPLYEADTKIKKIQKGTLMKYKNTMKDYLRSLKYKVGEGIVYFNNPNQLLDRLELLGGSILAGNNGVFKIRSL